MQLANFNTKKARHKRAFDSIVLQTKSTIAQFAISRKTHWRVHLLVLQLQLPK